SFSSWESIPWPANNRIFYHLRTDEDCFDLTILAEVSTHFRSGVKEFMKKSDNRPGVKSVHFSKDEDGISVEIQLYPSNLPFHFLDTLAVGRFKRFRGFSNLALEVTLNGINDPIFNQVSDLLSTSIKKDVRIYSNDFTPADFLLCSQLLRKSTFGKLVIYTTTVHDSNAPHILSMATHTKEILFDCDETHLADPAAFITELYSCVASVFVDECSSSTTSFFGLSLSFWKKFLNDRLANGTFEYIETGNMEGKITKAPFDLPDTPIEWLEWLKK
ncbi:hypothetical protein PMAYCL1PPCAC_22385, partial [Pristionchus mayeri]